MFLRVEMGRCDPSEGSILQWPCLHCNASICNGAQLHHPSLGMRHSSLQCWLPELQGTLHSTLGTELAALESNHIEIVSKPPGCQACSSAPFRCGSAQSTFTIEIWVRSLTWNLVRKGYWERTDKHALYVTEVRGGQENQDCRSTGLQLCGWHLVHHCPLDFLWSSIQTK